MPTKKPVHSRIEILLVDDKDIYHVQLGETIERTVPGVEVTHAYSKRDALQKIKARTKPFDAIVSDLDMETTRAGIDLLKELRREGDKTPFCLVSATDNIEYWAEIARKEGAQEVPEKEDFWEDEDAKKILERLVLTTRT